MIRRYLLAFCCVLWAVTCYAQTTAIRPDQISPGTPDITWGPGGSGYQIGTTVTWRQVTTATSTPPDFTSGDIAKIVELTFNGAITKQLPDATSTNGFVDGTGFAIQVGPGTLTLNQQSTASKINGATSIKIGSYQQAAMYSKGGNWYAVLSVPQPPAQNGATVLGDQMTWAAGGTGPGTTWNPADKAAAITLTGSNKTATNTAGTASVWQGVRATPTTKTSSSGKVYFEGTTTVVTLGNVSGHNNFIMLGIGNATASLANYIGPDTNSTGFYIGGAASPVADIVVNGTNNAVAQCNMAVAGGPYTIGIAIDFATSNFWCTLNGTNWNTGSGTPGAGTGGVSFSGLAAGPYLILGGVGGDGTNANSLSLNTAAPFTYTVPAGFSAWN
jgi:hypothetical protein